MNYYDLLNVLKDAQQLRVAFYQLPSSYEETTGTVEAIKKVNTVQRLKEWTVDSIEVIEYGTLLIVVK